MLISLSPKPRFQASEHSKAHAELVLKPGFHLALETSLAVFGLRQGVTEEQLRGVRDFIDVLLNLAEPEELSHPDAPAQNLWPNQFPPLNLPREQLLHRVKARQPHPPNP